jgi:hypothetical protein
MRSVTPEPDTDGDTFREAPYDAPTEEPSGEPNEAPRQVPIEEPSTDPKEIHRNDTINTRFDLSLLQEEDVSEPHSGLSKDEQEMMLWHLRLSHLPLARLLSMARLNLLPRRLLNVKKLFCSGCAFGRMTRRPWRTKTQPNVVIKTAERPGECISVDQLDSSVPGFIAQLKGTLTLKRYTAATVFVDNFSGLSYLHLQQNLTSSETIKAKDAFEAYAASYNVTIQHYHADNGRFADNAFRQSCQEKQQTISFCGVNAHWQNGMAEKRIRDLQDAATTSLLYAQCRWPDAIDQSLWPYALRHVNNVHNNTPLRGRKYSPLELFANVLIAPQLRHFHHFGAPAYVLNNDLQQGQKGKKWEQRARIGIYLGQSMQHACTVMLVLSLSSGNVSPQFHCQVDDSFAPVVDKNASLVPISEWQRKAKLKPSQIKAREQRPLLPLIPTLPTSPILTPQVGPPPAPEPIEEVDVQPQDDLQFVPDDPVLPDEPIDQPLPPPSPIPTRRSTRERRPPVWHRDYVPTDAVALPTLFEPALEAAQDLVDNPLFALKAVRQSDPDTIYLWQAMKQPDWAQFKQAMQEEVNPHTVNGHWKLIKQSHLPKGATVLPAIWSMKRKRRISTREVYKWKARLTVDGSKQKYGVHYDETYSPVVTWATTRFFLIQ